MERTDVLMAEYVDLRREISRRLAYQQAFMGLNLILVAALVPIYAVVPERADVALVAAPLLFTVLAWLHFSQDLTMISISTYLARRLRPAIQDSLSGGADSRKDARTDFRTDVLLGWETYEFENRSGEPAGLFQTYLWFLRCLAIMGPAVGFTVFGLARLDWNGIGGLAQLLVIGMVAGHLVLVVGVAVVTGWLPARYRAIPGPTAD